MYCVVMLNLYVDFFATQMKSAVWCCFFLIACSTQIHCNRIKQKKKSKIELKNDFCTRVLKLKTTNCDVCVWRIKLGIFLSANFIQIITKVTRNERTVGILQFIVFVPFGKEKKILVDLEITIQISEHYSKSPNDVFFDNILKFCVSGELF